MGTTIPAFPLYTISPGQNSDSYDAWCLVFGQHPADPLLDAGEIAFFADNPAILADVMAKDLMVLQKMGPLCVQENWMMWSLSPLVQAPQYFRLFTALLPSCPVNFDVFAKLKVGIDSQNLSDFAGQIDAAREELAFFRLWLHLNNSWTLLPIEESADGADGGTPAKEPRTASYDDYKKACEKLLSQTIKPTRAKIKEVLKGDFEKTLATDKFTTYRQRMLRECSTGPSAVRPPDSAD